MSNEILITGATSGIGSHLAHTFSYKGWHVIGTCRDITTHDTQTHNFELFQCDQSRMTEIENFVEKISGHQFDACILNAGVAAFSLFSKITEKDYDRIMNTNVRGTLFLLQKILNQLRLNSSVIIIGSVSHKLGLKGSVVYAASKAALKTAVQVLANELSERKIRVNMISPGLIDTNIYSKFQPDAQKIELLKQKMIEQTKIKRLGTVEEIAHLTNFLISDQSAYITGQDFVIDGGLTTGYF